MMMLFHIALRNEGEKWNPFYSQLIFLLLWLIGFWIMQMKWKGILRCQGTSKLYQLLISSDFLGIKVPFDILKSSMKTFKNVLKLHEKQKQNLKNKRTFPYLKFIRDKCQRFVHLTRRCTTGNKNISPFLCSFHKWKLHSGHWRWRKP